MSLRIPYIFVRLIFFQFNPHYMWGDNRYPPLNTKIDMFLLVRISKKQDPRQKRRRSCFPFPLHSLSGEPLKYFERHRSGVRKIK